MHDLPVCSRVESDCCYLCVCVRCAGGGVANAQWLVLSGPMGGPAPLSPLSRPMFPLCVSTSTTPAQAAHTSHRSRPLPSASTPHPMQVLTILRRQTSSKLSDQFWMSWIVMVAYKRLWTLLNKINCFNSNLKPSIYLWKPLMELSVTLDTFLSSFPNNVTMDGWGSSVCAFCFKTSFSL